MEKLLNVPLDKETRKLLDMRADENGRASSREAAKIIKDTVTAAAQVVRMTIKKGGAE